MGRPSRFVVCYTTRDGVHADLHAYEVKGASEMKQETIPATGEAAAVEECYDTIAVLLRMVDVLEGRQKLGKPNKGAKE